MDIQRFRSLNPRQRALVALAVLLDGCEAGSYLENDAVNGSGLKRAASEISSIEPDLRMPFAGTMLRGALEEIAR